MVIDCVLCGRDAPSDPPPVTWLLEQDTDERAEPVRRWICPDCVRRHVREIEARLDEDYW